MSDKQENVKFEEAMDIAGYGKFSIFIIFLSGMTICCSLLSSLDVSFLMPSAECDLQLTSQDKGLLGSAYFFGNIIGSHLTGFLADTLGRRYVLLRGLTINVFIYVCGALAPEFWMLLTLKVLSGIVTCPCMIATYPFMGEYMPAKRRSQSLLVTTSLSSMGYLYASLLGWAILQGTWSLDLIFIRFSPWRLFYLLCCLPSFICALLFYITPESPKFLLTRGKKGDTIKVLQRVHSVNSGTLPQNYPVYSVEVDADETLPAAREKGVAGVLKHVWDQTSPLFRPPYFRSLVICVIITFIMLFCVNAVLLWLPEVTNRIARFPEGPHSFCEMISRSVEPSLVVEVANTSCNNIINPAMFLPNLVIAVVQPVVMLSASLVVPHVDRRFFLMALLLVCSGMAFLMTRITNTSLIVILFGALPILSGVNFNIISSIQIELFPTYIRAMAVSLNMVCGRVGSIVGTSLFSHLLDNQCQLLFLLIASLFLAGAAVPLCLTLKKTPQPPKDKSSKMHTVKV